MQISAEERASRTLNRETALAAAEQVRINGYVVLVGILAKEKIEVLHQTFMNLFEAHIAKTEFNRGRNRAQMLLPFAEPFIDPELIENPFALPIMEELLGKDCAIKYFASDTPLPGSDYQHVHSDMGPLFPESSVTLPPTGIVLNIPLVDFRADNGPVEIWPGGTHLIPESANRPERIQELSKSMHAEPVLMPAGSLLIRDIRMWHRGTPNRSNAARPNLAMVYFRSWFNTEPKIEIPRATYDALSERARELFRFENIR